MPAHDVEAVSWRPAATAIDRRLLNRGPWRRVCIQARFRSGGKQIRSAADKVSACLHPAVAGVPDFATIPGLVNWEIRRTGSGVLVAPGRPIGSDTRHQKASTWRAAGRHETKPRFLG